MNTRRPWLPNMAQLLPEDPTGLPGGGALPPVPTPPVPRTFTQADVDAMDAQTRARAERSAKAALLAELGVTTADEAKAVLAAHRTAEQAQMTEQQRVTAAAEAAKAAADADRTSLAAERLAMQTEQALIRSGVPLEIDQDGKRVPNPQLAGLARLVNVQPGADAAAIAAAVTEVKATYPQLFAAPAAAPAGGAPPPPRPPRNGGNGAQEAGASGRQALTEFGYVKRPPAG